ncbi:DinB family protein [Flavihumibacter sp. R14]|nr:DinB family protein [Flavihumibacter soli]
MNRPQDDEFAPYYATYINTVSENVLGEMEYQATSLPALLKLISDEKSCYAYAVGKWTIKELVGHMIDTERIMAYRALRIARNDKTPLAGFEENDYVANASFNDRNLQSLADEFAAVRRANSYFFNSLTEEEYNRRGTASEKPVSVRALLYILVGHVNHHRRILEERYL